VIFKFTENSFDLTRETKDCITRYQIIYKRVINGSKNRENDRYILNAKNKTKSVAYNKQKIWEIPSIWTRNCELEEREKKTKIAATSTANCHHKRFIAVLKPYSFFQQLKINFCSD